MLEVVCPICGGAGETSPAHPHTTYSTTPLSIACDACYGGGLVLISPSRNVHPGSRIDRQVRIGAKTTFPPSRF